MNELEKLYNKSLRFLSYRPRSEKEVADYLSKKLSKAKSASGGNPEDIIKEVIKKLKEYKFINDEEFSRWWIESRTKIKPRSWRTIGFELKNKGISKEVIEEEISKLKDKVSDLEMAKKLLEKKIKRYKDLPRQEIYQKLGRFLASKGFNWDTIKQSINEMLKT